VGKTPAPHDKRVDLVEVIIGQNSCKLEDLIKRRVQAARLGVIDDIPHDSLRIFAGKYCENAFRSTTYAATALLQDMTLEPDRPIRFGV